MSDKEEKIFQKYLSNLESYNIKKRVYAVKKLGKMNDSRALDPLIRILNDDNPILVKTNAARALGDIGDKRAIEQLLLTLNEDDEILVKKSAASGLTRLGDSDVISSLLKFFECEEHVGVQKSIIETIGVLGGNKEITFLIDLYNQSKDKNIKISIVSALGSIGGQKSEEFLINLLERERNVQTHYDIFYCHLIWTLYEFNSERVVDSFIKYFPEDYHYSSMPWALSKIDGKRIEELFIRSLESDHLIVIEKAAMGLSNMKVYSAIEPLFKVLESGKETYSSAKALVKFEDEHICDRLIDLLQKTQIKTVKVSIIKALAEMNYSKSSLILLELLEQSNDIYLREEIITSLIELGDIQSIESIISYLNADDSIIPWGIKYLGKFKDSKFVEPLIKILKEGRSHCKSHAVQALVDIGDKQAVETFIEILKEYIYNKNDFEKKYLSSSIQLLKSLLKGLGKFKDKRAVEILNKFIQTNKTDDTEYIRKVAERVLVKLTKE